MKKQWIDPIIYSNPRAGWGGEDTWEAPGSGQSTPDPDASWSYADWLEIYADFPNILNYDGQGASGTIDDYIAWYNAIFNMDPPEDLLP